jgi:hypothetical protein
MAGRCSLPAVAGLGVLLACLFLVHAPYLSGAKLYYHDSINGVTMIGLFYDRLFTGASWLWSSDLNAGHPLWVLIESAPFLDPVAGPVYLVCSVLGTNWFVPYQITAVLWLVLFSLGGASCVRHVTCSPWPGVLIFLLLFGGPLAVMSPAQSWGFLIPFRFFPWLLWAYLRLRAHVTTANVVALCAIATISLASYQSAYPLTAMVLLFVAEVLVQRGEFFRWLAQLLRARYVIWMAMPLLAASPTLAYLQYSGYLVVIPRLYKSDEIYLFEAARFFDGLFFPLSSLLRTGYINTVWHGTTYLGVFAAPLLVHGLRRTAGQIIRPHGKPCEVKVSALLAVWCLMVATVACGGLGLSGYLEERGSLLGVRNFGFLLTVVLFLLALLAAVGFSEILKNGFTLSDVALDTLLFALFAVVYIALVGPAEAPPELITVSAGTFAGAGLLIYILRRFGPTSDIFAASVMLLMAVEILVVTGSTVSSLGRNVALMGIARQVDQSLERSPRLAETRERFQLNRPFGYPIEESWPLVLAAPAVNKEPAALLIPEVPPKLGVGVVSHLFRLRPFENFVTGPIDPASVQAVLGVTRPIVELLPRSAFADDLAGDLALVLRCRGLEDVSPEASNGQIRVLAFSGDHLSADLEAPVESVLVYRDNVAPGWSVTVDGEKAELVVVDRINKAVAVPPGQHQVEFSYRPWPYLIAFWLRTLATIVALAAIAWLVIHGVRRSRVT